MPQKPPVDVVFPDGVLVVDKPVGPTSHDVVAAARRALGVRRVGHTGTLDPNASGVLPLVLGRATRLAQFLTASDKEYEATVRFGIETDTYDSAGQKRGESGRMPALDELEAALPRFRGSFDQVPPAFSAKKVGGERAYHKARRSAPVDLDPVCVMVHSLEIVAVDPPRATLRIACSSGFYVRSLAHDLGQVVGTGAMLERLVRTRAGEFSLADAMPLGNLVASTAAHRIVPLEDLLLDLPAITLTTSGARHTTHGSELGPADWAGSVSTSARRVRLIAPDGRLLGIAEPAKTPGFLHPSVVFG